MSRPVPVCSHRRRRHATGSSAQCRHGVPAARAGPRRHPAAPRRPVDERDIAAIRELRASGVTVTIVTGRLHSGRRSRPPAPAGSRARSPAWRAATSSRSAGKTLAPPRDDAGDTGAAARRVRRARPRELHVRGRRHPPRRARRAVRAVRRTWSPRLRLVEEALDARVWANDPLAAVAIGDEAEVVAAHAVLRAHAERHLLGQVPGVAAYPASTRSSCAPPARQGHRAAPRCASAPAARSPRRSPSVTGSTTCRCSRSPAGLRDGRCARRTCARRRPTCSERPAGTGGGIAEAVRRAWG